jgi:catalase
LELNRNPDEYFPQTEQIAFCTSHIVPGIGFSNDPLLQGRNFSYFDTQITRLGINFQELPINRPVCPVMNNNRDGGMRHTITRGKANYWPNRFEDVPPASKEEGGYVDYAEKIVGIKARLRSPKFQEHYNQAALFYNSLSPIEQAHVLAGLSFELDHCEDPIVYERITQRLAEAVSFDLSKQVAELVGADVPTHGRMPDGQKIKGMSQLEFMPEIPTIATRRIAILIADGYDGVAYTAIKAALSAAGALPFTIATRRTPIYAAGEDKSGGKGVKPDHHFEGMRSTMFDSIYIPGGAQSIKTLSANGRALHWVREAFGHLKAIGATGEGVELVRKACGLEQMVFSTSGEVVESYGVVTADTVKQTGLDKIVKMVSGAKNFVEAYGFAISQHRNWDRELDGLNKMVAY